MCLAQMRDGTGTATRRRGRADRSAKLHQRFVGNSNIVGREGVLTRAFPSPTAHGGVVARARLCADALQNARNVSVDNRCAHAKHNRCDRACGVAPDSRKSRERLEIRGNHPAVNFHDAHRGGLQQTRASVVAQALPRRKDLVFTRGGQCCGRGKSSHKRRKFLEHARDLRLLQHQFAHQGEVAVACLPPGQIARAGAKPRLEKWRDRARGLGFFDAQRRARTRSSRS